MPEPGEVSPVRPRLHLGLPEAALVHQAGLITKAEVRAVVLAKLKLFPGQILWDVGGGAGSVGLEASLLIPGGKIFAVERHPERAAQIAANREKFGVDNLDIVCAPAPVCLAQLPDPHRVFVGGGGPEVGAIIQEAVRRLAPEGRIVVTAALLETLATARHDPGTGGLGSGGGATPGEPVPPPGRGDGVAGLEPGVDCYGLVEGRAGGKQ